MLRGCSECFLTLWSYRLAAGLSGLHSCSCLWLSVPVLLALCRAGRDDLILASRLILITHRPEQLVKRALDVTAASGAHFSDMVLPGKVRQTIGAVSKMEGKMQASDRPAGTCRQHQAAGKQTLQASRATARQGITAAGKQAGSRARRGYLCPLSGPAGWRSAGTGLPAFCAMTAMLVSKDSSLVRSQSTSSKAPAVQGMKLCSELRHDPKACTALQWLEASLQSSMP